MTDSELETIRAEAEHAPTKEHVEALLAEIYRLQSEIHMEKATYWAGDQGRTYGKQKG